MTEKDHATGKKSCNWAGNQWLYGCLVPSYPCFRIMSSGFRYSNWFRVSTRRGHSRLQKNCCNLKRILQLLSKKSKVKHKIVSRTFTGKHAANLDMMIACRQKWTQNTPSCFLLLLLLAGLALGISISSILVVYMELRLDLRLREVENLGEKEWWSSDDNVCFYASCILCVTSLCLQWKSQPTSRVFPWVFSPYINYTKICKSVDSDGQ